MDFKKLWDLKFYHPKILWDLTNAWGRVYHGNVIGKLLDQLGLGLASLLGKAKKKRESPVTRERVRFEQDVKEQFVQLKKKGLSIPVFTL